MPGIGNVQPLDRKEKRTKAHERLAEAERLRNLNADFNGSLGEYGGGVPPSGTLDFVLLKPIDSQFWLSLRTLSPAGLPEIGLGLGLLAWGSHQAGVVLTLSSLLTVLVMLLAGGLILYSLWFLIAATSIWFVKTWNATEVLRALLASGRYPLNAYPPALRLLFTLVLPVAFLTTVPAQVLLGEAAAPMLLAGLGLAVLFFAAARAFWLFALRFYTSASS